jgi:hypothetical protein
MFNLLNVKIKIPVYRTYNSSCCFYGRENWSLKMKEECRLRVLENRVLRRIFGPKRDEVTREWTKLHNEEHYDLYSSPNIIRVIKSRRMRWAEHVALCGGGEVHIVFWWGNLSERDHLEEPEVDGRIILEWVYGKWVGRAWTGLIWLKIETGGEHL